MQGNIKDRGVVIIACGNQQYGCMAQNLAASIRFGDIMIPITIFHHGQALDFVRNSIKKVADEIVLLDDEIVTNAGVIDYLKAKTHLYDLSPYKETIFVDADVILFDNRKISDLFEELKDLDFTCECRGLVQLKDNPDIHWTSAKNIQECYNYDGDFYNISSELMYFKKTDDNKDFFDMVKELYLDPKLPFNKFNGGVADELAFQLAMIIKGVKPHKDIWIPFYWQHFEKKYVASSHHIKNDYWGYSIGGNRVDKDQERIYNGLAKFYANEFGVIGYPARNKEDYLSKRKEK